MSNVVDVDGKTVELQEAFDAMSHRMKRMQDTLNESIAAANASSSLADKTQFLNDPMNETTINVNAKPSFDLVSSINSYDGTRADLVVPFFDSVEGIRELSGWTESQTLQVIKLKLTGSALQFAKSDEACKNARSCHEIREALVMRFGDNLPDHYYFEQLANIRQNRGETIEQFADRVKKVSDKTMRISSNEEVNKVLRDELDRRATDAFVRGLFGEVGRQARIKFPKNFREAVSTAVAINNVERHPRQMEDPPRRIFGAVARGACHNCGRQGHIARFCRQTQPTPIPVVTCNFCKRRGHQEAECRTKMASQRNNNNPVARCGNCGRQGHPTENCWSRRPPARGGFNHSRGRGGVPTSGNQHSLNNQGESRPAAATPSQ